MTILRFDPAIGVYHFEFQELSTEFHAHPVVEIILAKKGDFVLSTPTKEYTGLRLAIIESNVTHRLDLVNGEVQVLTLECNNPLLREYLGDLQLTFRDGLFLSTSTDDYSADLILDLIQLAETSDLRQATDPRVQICLQTLSQPDTEYRDMMEKLTQVVFLSESRLSHLFKQTVGVSLKKYLLWSRLRQTVYLVISEGLNLGEAAHQSGFYDQAHLSRAFKKCLGIAPGKVYNSRTVQV